MFVTGAWLPSSTICPPPPPSNESSFSGHKKQSQCTLERHLEGPIIKQTKSRMSTEGTCHWSNGSSRCLLAFGPRQHFNFKPWVALPTSTRSPNFNWEKSRPNNKGSHSAKILYTPSPKPTPPPFTRITRCIFLERSYILFNLTQLSCGSTHIAASLKSGNGCHCRSHLPLWQMGSTEHVGSKTVTSAQM